MYRFGFGLALLIMAVVTTATELENSVYSRQPDLLPVQIAQFDFDGLVRAKPYQLSLNIVPVYSAANVTFGSGFSRTSQLSPVAESHNAWATSNNWGQFFGKALLVMAVATTSTELENSVYFHQPDLLTVQIAQFDLDGLVRAKPYQLSLSIVPVYSAANVPFGSGFSRTSQLSPFAESHNAWAKTNNWGQFFGKDHLPSLLRLRLESKGEWLEIKPRRHSVSIQWSKTY